MGCGWSGKVPRFANLYDVLCTQGIKTHQSCSMFVIQAQPSNVRAVLQWTPSALATCGAVFLVCLFAAPLSSGDVFPKDVMEAVRARLDQACAQTLLVEELDDGVISFESDRLQVQNPFL